MPPSPPHQISISLFPALCTTYIPGLRFYVKENSRVWKWLLNRKFHPISFVFFLWAPSYIFTSAHRLDEYLTASSYDPPVGHENSLWALILKSHVVTAKSKFLGLCIIYMLQYLGLERSLLLFWL
jgi:hypothetical protein